MFGVLAGRSPWRQNILAIAQSVQIGGGVNGTAAESSSAAEKVNSIK